MHVSVRGGMGVPAAFLALVFFVGVSFFSFRLEGFVGGGSVFFAGGFIFSGRARARGGDTTPAGVLGEAELGAIVKHLSDAVLVYDKDFAVSFFNPAAETLFGLSAGEVVGHRVSPQDAERENWRPLVQVMFPSLAPVMKNLSEAGTNPQVMDISIADPTMELRVITTEINEGPRTFIKIIYDRTKEVAVVKSKSEFMTLASHQLRGPVTNIEWALEALSQDDTLSETNREIARRALDAARQLLIVVEDLLKASQVEEIRFGLKLEPIDLVGFIENLLGEFMPQAKQMGVAIYFDRPKEPLPHIAGDKERLFMVLQNLLDNAIRYNVKNGEVTVKLEKRNDAPFIEVSVKDTGIGMTAEDLEKIFEKFYRAPNALKYNTHGSGLGLYIAKGIIRAHGGKMWAESELNRGSVFYFTLPLEFHAGAGRE